jgi:hypothetical protein
MHETEQEAGTPQQFTPITVGPLVKISDKLQTKKNQLISLTSSNRDRHRLDCAMCCTSGKQFSRFEHHSRRNKIQGHYDSIL